MAWADELKKLTQGTQKQTEPQVAPKPSGEQRQDGILTQKADGSLTDYGKSLRSQLEAQQIASSYKAPVGFDANRGMYGGLTPTYEAYVSNAYGMGNQAASREAWQGFIDAQNKPQTERERDGSSTGSTGSTGGTSTGGMGTGGNYGVTDNSSLISQSYEAQKNAAVDALRNAIAKAKGTYQTTIKEAPGAFRPLKDQTTVAANQQLTKLRESMAEQGQAGGISRSEETAVGSARENQLNALNQQEQKIIADANSSIAQLEADGQFQEAQLVSQNAIEKLRALTEESNRVEQETYNRKTAQDAINREAQQLADQRAYNEQQKLEERTYKEQQTEDDRIYKEQQNKAQQDREDYKSNIGQFGDNYQAEINRLEGRTNVTNFGKGNINLNDRPIIKNEDGTISTIRSISINEDGKEVLIPTVRKGIDRIMTDKEAIDWYKKTGEHLGKFNTVEDADSYANSLHEEQSNQYANIDEETQWKISQLKSARAEKIANMSESRQNEYIKSLKSEQEKQEQAFELAKWRFNNGLPATQMDAQLLGVKVGQVSPSQAIKNAELQLQKQKESRISSKSSGGSGGSSSSKTAKSPVTLTDYEQSLKSTFTEYDTPETKSQKAAEFIIKNKSNLSNDIIQRLATRYNVTEKQIQDYTNMEKFNVMKNL